MRLKGKRHERAGRTDGQSYMMGGHTVHFVIASVAPTGESADFSEALHRGQGCIDTVTARLGVLTASFGKIGSGSHLR